MAYGVFSTAVVCMCVCLDAPACACVQKTLSSMFGDLKDSSFKGQHGRHQHNIKITLLSGVFLVEQQKYLQLKNNNKKKTLLSAARTQEDKG